MSLGTDKHGGNVLKEARDFGIEPGELLDFSANINPLGIPEGLKNKIRTNLDCLVNYPDPDCTGLRKGISGHFQIPDDRVIVGNGASEIIYLLFSVLKLRTLLIPVPAFSEYESAAHSCGVRIEYLKLREENNFEIETQKIIAALDRVDAVMLCNPNNPTSQLTTKDDLYPLLCRAKEKGVYLIIDETFIELTSGQDANSMIEALHGFDNLFVVRAFTKLFAVPGLRAGYGLGSSELVESMWKAKPPWSVNSFALLIDDIFEREGEYLSKTARWICEEPDWLYGQLLSFGKLKPFKPHTNFILIKLNGALTASKLKAGLIRRGILIRDASNFVNLDERYVRVAVKDRESNKRLLEALGEELGS